MSEWIYDGAEFTSEMIGDNIGFVYCVTDTQTGMKYIGKKLLISKITRPPLKGQKRKRKSFKESDWKTYCGSSEEVKALVEESGLDRFSREILKLCTKKGELSYYETKAICDADALLKPDEYFNCFLGARIHRKHILAALK